MKILQMPNEEERIFKKGQAKVVLRTREKSGEERTIDRNVLERQENKIKGETE